MDFHWKQKQLIEISVLIIGGQIKCAKSSDFFRTIFMMITIVFMVEYLINICIVV